MQAPQVIYAYAMIVDLLPCLSDMLAAYLLPKVKDGKGRPLWVSAGILNFLGLLLSMLVAMSISQSSDEGVTVTSDLSQQWSDSNMLL